MVTDKKVIQEWKAFLESEEYRHDSECGTLLIAKHFADWQKERMMRGAIEGIVICNEVTHGTKDILMDIPEDLNVGDKVKLLITRM